MKRISLVFAIAGLTILFAFGQKKEIRSVSGFTGIDASSVFEITVTKGSVESLVVEADDDVMQYVRSEVRNGVLHLYLDKNNRLKNIKTLKASVVMKNFDSASLSGACKLVANDLFTPDKFKGECSGASHLTVHINTGQLNIRGSGASKIQAKANVTGDATMNFSGASNVKLDLKAENVKFNSSGSCSADVSGSAKNFNIDASGSSNINAGDFTVETVSVKSSGSGKISVHATNDLNINSSGASTVKYKGAPAINVNSSGSSKVRKM